MTASEIIKHLEPLGADSYKRILLNHGAAKPLLGVKVEELKKIQKRRIVGPAPAARTLPASRFLVLTKPAISQRLRQNIDLRMRYDVRKVIRMLY